MCRYNVSNLFANASYEITRAGFRVKGFRLLRQLSHVVSHLAKHFASAAWSMYMCVYVLETESVCVCACVRMFARADVGGDANHERPCCA